MQLQTHLFKLPFVLIVSHLSGFIAFYFYSLFLSFSNHYEALCFYLYLSFYFCEALCDICLLKVQYE